MTNKTTAKKLAAIVVDVKAAGQALPIEDRTAYADAKDSVVEARRKAPSHEGRLQIS